MTSSQHFVAFTSSYLFCHITGEGTTKGRSNFEVSVWLTRCRCLSESSYIFKYIYPLCSLTFNQINILAKRKYTFSCKPMFFPGDYKREVFFLWILLFSTLTYLDVLLMVGLRVYEVSLHVLT